VTASEFSTSAVVDVVPSGSTLVSAMFILDFQCVPGFVHCLCSPESFVADDESGVHLRPSVLSTPPPRDGV